MEKRIGFEPPRIIALIIDAVIIAVVMGIIQVILRGWVGGIIAQAAVLAYWFTEVMNGASPGKMIMGLKIAAADGGAASQDVLLKRYFVKQAAGFIFLVAAVLNIIIIHGLLVLAGALVGLGLAFGSLYIVLRPEKQALWDQMANTAVFPASNVMVTETYNPPGAPPPYNAAPEAPVVPPPPPPPPVGAPVEP